MINKSDFGKKLYSVTLFFIVLSGFGAMPIFKRYYIADIPGLGWLAKFYTTHFIHYTTGLILIGLVFYYMTTLLLDKKRISRITKIGWAGFISVLCLVISGVLLVIKNLNGIYFNHVLISALDLIHLVFCMGLLGITGLTVLRKKEWINPDI